MNPSGKPYPIWRSWVGGLLRSLADNVDPPAPKFLVSWNVAQTQRRLEEYEALSGLPRRDNA
jgi:hypothetical protein